MRRAALALALVPGVVLAQPELPDLPSGARIALQEVLIDTQTSGQIIYARFRFVAPEIGSALSYVDVMDDFPLLCDDFAAPQVAQWPDAVDQIVISFASRESEFGVADAEVTQFFEAFRLEDGRCIWEGF